MNHVLVCASLIGTGVEPAQTKDAWPLVQNIMYCLHANTFNGTII